MNYPIILYILASYLSLYSCLYTLAICLYLLQFSEKFIVEYHFEEIQLYCVKLYDIDDKNNIDDQSKQDFIGQAEFTLADVVTAGKAFSKELTLPSQFYSIVHMFVHTHAYVCNIYILCMYACYYAYVYVYMCL